MSFHCKFLFYHPYLTYRQSRDFGSFIRPDGKKRKSFGRASDSLWHLGRDAFSHFDAESKEFFEENLRDYFLWIDLHRNGIRKLGVVCIDEATGKECVADVDDFDEYTVLSIVKDFYEKAETSANLMDALASCFLMCCLRNIDAALIAAEIESFEGMHYATVAAKAFCNFNALTTAAETRKNERVKLAKKAADARHSETRAMREELLEWYEKNKDTFPSKDKAAEEAMKQAPISFRTARKWIAGFGKHPSAGRG